jgi:hypothetical protein
MAEEPRKRAPHTIREEPVNAIRAELYRRLMDAQEQIAHALYQRGTSDEQVLAALDGADEQMTEDERREDLYLSALAHYVAALGGRLEVRAVFGEDEIVVRRIPTPDADASPSWTVARKGRSRPASITSQPVSRPA